MPWKWPGYSITGKKYWHWWGMNNWREVRAETGTDEAHTLMWLADAPCGLVQPLNSCWNLSPVRYRHIKPVIAGERDDQLRELCRLQLELGGAHFNAQPFRFGTARDYTSIVVTEHHNGLITQVRTKRQHISGAQFSSFSLNFFQKQSCLGKSDEVLQCSLRDRSVRLSTCKLANDIFDSVRR